MSRKFSRQTFSPMPAKNAPSPVQRRAEASTRTGPENGGEHTPDASPCMGETSRPGAGPSANVVGDAHPPRVPRKKRKTWNVGQLRTFLQHARQDRFFALWVLEVTSGTRRCELAGARKELLDLDLGTLEIGPTRVVVNGKVIESDGKTENAQHILALDPLTLAVLEVHVVRLDLERIAFGPNYLDEYVRETRFRER